MLHLDVMYIIGGQELIRHALGMKSRIQKAVDAIGFSNWRRL